ncbi:hypothetical protein [Chitinophaga sp. HK235]|uniref:hypothetical protein n=1 Tax=Chitinophaga sp. HK235 TaxID=2952571 RepID=UPI001BA4811F|nr:hypothetical protein [Chitinophaga sp. HK235]
MDGKIGTLETRADAGFREMDGKLRFVDLHFEAVDRILLRSQNDIGRIAEWVPFRTHSVQPLSRD